MSALQVKATSSDCSVQRDECPVVTQKWSPMNLFGWALVGWLEAAKRIPAQMRAIVVSCG
jgi:hypothetical protein